MREILTLRVRLGVLAAVRKQLAPRKGAAIGIRQGSVANSNCSRAPVFSAGVSSAVPR